MAYPPAGPDAASDGGLGHVGRWDGAVQEIRPGDTVWIAPGEKHWHGASADCAMTHIAIAEMQDGKAVDWMEPVTNEQYAGC